MFAGEETSPATTFPPIVTVLSVSQLPAIMIDDKFEYIVLEDGEAIIGVGGIAVSRFHWKFKVVELLPAWSIFFKLNE